MKLQPLLAWWILVIYLVLVVGFIAWQTWQYRDLLKHKKFAQLKSWYRQIALLLLPLIIALGISVQGGVSSPGISNLNVYFAIDTTPSMGATDYNGDDLRISGAEHDALRLANKLKGAHLEVITFDNTANIILPLTSDTTAFSTAIKHINPQSTTLSRGSSIDEPIDLLSQELSAHKKAFPDRQNVVFYFGDGEQTTNQPVKSFAGLAKYVSAGAVLGYGTAKGAHMVDFEPFQTSHSKTSYITTIGDHDRVATATSKMDKKALQKIASQMKLTYQDRNHGGSISQLYKTSRVKLAVDHSQHVVHYFNLYWLFAIPFIGLIFWDWQKVLFKNIKMRRQQKDVNG